MMNARLNKALVALLAVAAVGACDDPPIEPGNSDPARIFRNPGHVILEAGGDRQVQAYLVNDLGQAVSGDVDFEACDGNVTVEADTTQTDIEPGSNFIITAGNTLGASCVIVSGASFEDTIGVSIVPAELDLTLQDTILSGTTTAAALVFLNAGGTTAAGFDLDEVEFSSLDEDIAVVDASGNVTAQAPGDVQIVVTLNEELGADRADTIDVVVVPGAFSGSVTPATGESGTETTLEFGAGDPTFDETSTAVAISGSTEYPLFQLTGSDANTVMTAIPFGTAAGDITLSLRGLGDGEVALATSFDVTTATTNDPFGARDPFLGEAATAITLPFETVAAIDGGNGEANDGFIVTPTTTATYDVYLDWDDANGSHDMDVLVYDITADDYHACTGDVATGDHPEVGECDLVAGNPYFIIINDFDAAASTTNYHLRITPQ